LNSLSKYLEEHNRINKSAKIGINVCVKGSDIGANVSIGDYSNIRNSKMSGNVNFKKNTYANGAVITG
jgi:bifunctional N-acetylglucosamine-1-phosphate-uridyltransferase/glucosamine-1-phosphate-acetyltransferase GlmU-like protein